MRKRNLLPEQVAPVVAAPARRAAGVTAVRVVNRQPAATAASSPARRAVAAARPSAARGATLVPEVVDEAVNSNNAAVNPETISRLVQRVHELESQSAMDENEEDASATSKSSKKKATTKRTKK